MLLKDASHPVVPSLRQGANTAFEDAYELAVCLSAAADIETALKNYENSRIPRTSIIYERSATAGYHSYQADSETTMGETINSSQISENEFEVWRYRYQPTSCA